MFETRRENRRVANHKLRLRLSRSRASTRRVSKARHPYDYPLRGDEIGR